MDDDGIRERMPAGVRDFHDRVVSSPGWTGDNMRAREFLQMQMSMFTARAGVILRHDGDDRLPYSATWFRLMGRAPAEIMDIAEHPQEIDGFGANTMLRYADIVASRKIREIGDRRQMSSVCRSVPDCLRAIKAMDVETMRSLPCFMFLSSKGADALISAVRTAGGISEDAVDELEKAIRPHFMDEHVLFKELANDLFSAADDIIGGGHVRTDPVMLMRFAVLFARATRNPCGCVLKPNMVPTMMEKVLELQGLPQEFIDPVMIRLIPAVGVS